MTPHVRTRNRIKEIPELSTFNDLLDRSTLTPDEKKFMRLHYLYDKDFRAIGDELGYAEVTMKKWHSRILKKLSRLL